MKILSAAELVLAAVGVSFIVHKIVVFVAAKLKKAETVIENVKTAL